MTTGKGIVISAAILGAVSFIVWNAHEEQTRCVEMWRAASKVTHGRILWTAGEWKDSAGSEEAKRALEAVFGTTFEECRN